MATTTIPNNDSVGNLQALLNLYGSAKGSSTTSTTSSNLNQTDVSALIQSILGGTQGLAAVSSGQKTAGLRGSTVNQQLINDLLARVTTQTSAQTAGTKTTNKTAGKLGGNELLTLLAMSGGSKILGPSIEKFGSSFDDLGKSIADMFGPAASPGTATELVPASSGALSGVSSEMIGGSNASSATSLLEQLSGGSGETANLATSQVGAFAGNGADNLSQAAASAASDEAVASGGSAVGSLTGDSTAGSGGNLMSYLGTALNAKNAYETNGDYRSTIGAALLTYFGAGAAAPIVSAVAQPLSDRAMKKGEDLNGVAGAIQAEPIGALSSNKYEGSDLLKAATDPADIFGGNEGGSISGTLGAALDPIGAALGGDTVAAEIGNWVICTELYRQNHLPADLYLYSGLRALTLSAAVMTGYHSWAIPVARWMATSPRLSRVILPIATARCNHLAGKSNFIGWLTVAVGEPICASIGHIVIALRKQREASYG